MTGTTTTPRRTRLAPTAFLLGAVCALTACGSSAGPQEYGTGQRSIKAEVGDKFTLSFPMQPTQGEWWYRVDPEPDEKIVRSEGDREDYEGSGGAGGGDGTQFFDFEAIGAGTTEIRILHCPVGTCVGKGATASPKPDADSTNSDQADKARYYTFEVTVRS
ncbi:protease inhibitor I42 family protein [Streptomyces sp. NPDC090994]|uniref:protease inhibitor I42 family protein n=1 Tax=Streptomyces sp. NPDC090994 TaxID=3365969 RepID=UPI00382E2541